MAGRQMMLLAVVMAVAVAGVRSCTHNRHCDPDSCCKVGFIRYSSPSCSPRGVEGTPCSPVYAQPSGPRTLHYPKNFKIEIEEAHFGQCPCLPHLLCISGTCQRPPLYSSNSLSIEFD